MNSVSLPKFGARFLAYTVMDKSKVINKLATRISGGKITLDTLAKDLISNTMSLGQHHVAANRLLGKRTVEIVNQVRGVLFDNTRQQVENGIADFTALIIKSKGMSPQIQRAASAIAQYFGPALVGEKALERVLRALTAQPGGENVLKLALQNALSAVTGGKIISATFMSVLNRAILDPKLAYAPPTVLHNVVAWKLHQSLTTDPSSLPPPPMGLGSVETLLATVSTALTSLCQGLDTLQKNLGFPSREFELSSVFTECWPSDLAVHENTTHKDFIKTVLKAYATGQGDILDRNITALPSGMRESYLSRCNAIRAVLFRMPEAVIKIGQNWSGDIETLKTSVSKDHPPAATLVEFINKEFRAPVHLPDEVASFFADGEFIKSFKEGIDLTVDNSHQGYGHRIISSGYQLMSAAKNWWVGQHDLPVAKQRQLSQLSELVSHNAMSLMALSRYLIPSSISDSVTGKVLNQFNRLPPDRVLVDNVWLTLGEPNISFVVSKNKGVDIDISLVWPVTQFGKSPGELANAQHGRCSLSSKVKVHMLFDQHGLAKQEMSIADTHLALQENVTFAPTTAVIMDAPITLVNRGSLRTAVEMVSTC